jgi:SET domain
VEPFQQYALVVSDTVKVTKDGAILLTEMPCRLAEIAYDESDSITTMDVDDSHSEDELPIADSTDLRSTVKRVYEEVEQEREAAEYEQLQEFLYHKRDKVLEEVRVRNSTKRRSVCPVLEPKPDAVSWLDPSAVASPAATGSALQRPKFSVRYHRSSASVGSVCSIPISAVTKPLPSHSVCVPVRKSHWADDSKELIFVPNLGEDAGDIGALLSMHDTTHRENLIAYGAECQQEQTNNKIDDILRRVFGEMTSRGSDRRAHISPAVQAILVMIADLMGEANTERIRSRYEILTRAHGPTGEADRNKASESSIEDLDERFRKKFDSYRELWCRRCYTYDCNLHGIREKPKLTTQLELGLKKERSRFWQMPDISDLAGTSDANEFSRIAELSDFQKSICKQIYCIFEGDVAKMSCVMRAPVRLIQEFIDAKQITGTPSSTISSLTSKSDLPYYSVKNYKPTWYNRYRDAEIFPFFFPCHHDEKCSDDNCTCIQRRFFCTKACGWGNESPNFFRGCGCKGPCKVNCTCLLAKRECDPNLCKCDGFLDPPGKPAVSQRCRNDSILMQRGPSLLIGRSEVSGWGLFTKHSLKAGDFVGEYTGEAISQEEAERRGQIADAKDCSYLFMIASDVVLDGSRKGNKTRYINHSDTPNVKPRSKFCSVLFRALRLIMVAAILC